MCTLWALGLVNTLAGTQPELRHTRLILGCILLTVLWTLRHHEQFTQVRSKEAARC
jgi:hypothetical protein